MAYSAGYGGAPWTYQQIMGYASSYQPNTIHVTDTALSGFFQRYLTQKIIGKYEIENMPEYWSETYVYYTLVLNGYFSIIETDKFGIIPQHCGLYGFDVQYQPTNVTIGNPLLKGIMRPRIGTQCALVKMQPDYGGAWDLIHYYADMMALASETAATDLINCKLAYIFMAKNKAMADSFKKLYQQISSGQPAAFADKNLFDDEGNALWQQFGQDLKSNYIFGDILEDLIKLETRFDSEIGIDNVNIAKASGVSDSEVQANNVAVQTRAELWLRTIQKGCDQANDLFGLNLKAVMKGGQDNAGFNRDNEQGISGNME